MTDNVALPEPPLRDASQRLAALQPAEIVVSVPACLTVEAVTGAAAAARALADETTHRIVLVYPEHVVAADIGVQATGGALQILPWALPPGSRPALAPTGGRDAFVPLATIGSRVEARALVLMAGQPESVSADAIRLLAAPVLNGEADLVLPCYPRHPLDGLINTAIVYPLVRALYGRQADGQLGLDFGLSARMVASVVQPSRTPQGAVWLLSLAAERNLPMAQAHLPAWLPPADDAGDLSASLTQVLGSLFTDLEQHATTWQRVRGSRPVPFVGHPMPPPDERRPVDVRSMIESFQLGYRNLQEVWTRVLPPAALVALGRLARAPADGFRMPDDLWARVVYDIALGHRLRTINRDHLLRALTPIYLGWVASFAHEVADAGRDVVRRRLAAVADAFETQKPYLLARWRWPDRFTP